VSKGFRVTVIALKEKIKATKCSDHGTISVITYTAKIVVKIRRRRIETKMEVVFVEAHRGFRGVKERGMQMGC
jgi:hypothetical protein